MNAADKEYWRQLFEIYKESSSQFDKQILFISGGALGLSMTFIKDIVSLETAHCKCLLAVCWIVLSLVIFGSLLSHYFSMKATNEMMKNLHSGEDEKTNLFNHLTVFLNLFALIGTFVALILLVTFVSLNI